MTKQKNVLPTDPSKQTADSFGDVMKPKDSGKEERRSLICNRVQEHGFVTIEFLSNEFAVTPQTIRRDIKMLSEAGRVNRYHGGVGMASSTENVSYNKRKILRFKEKQAIAHMVARHIPNHSSVFINIGTTTEAVADALKHHKGLRVITNNLNVAVILGGNENFEIIMAGGLVRHKDCGIVGPLTIDFIQQFRVDYGVIGISGIDMDGAMLDFDYREVRAARAIIDNSRKVFLAADHSKFGRNAMVRLGTVEEIDGLFTDREPLPELTDKLNAAGVKLYVAGKGQ